MNNNAQPDLTNTELILITAASPPFMVLLAYYFIVLDGNYPLALIIAASVGFTFGWLGASFRPFDKFRRGRVGLALADFFNGMLKGLVIMAGLFIVGNVGFSIIMLKILSGAMAARLSYRLMLLLGGSSNAV